MIWHELSWFDMIWHVWFVSTTFSKIYVCKNVFKKLMLKQYFPQKIVQDKPESIGKGAMSSGMIYLYGVRPGRAPDPFWRPSYDHLIGQHTSKVPQHTHGFSNTHVWRITLTGSLQPLLRTPIHCVHYWGKTLTLVKSSGVRGLALLLSPIRWPAADENWGVTV